MKYFKIMKHFTFFIPKSSKSGVCLTLTTCLSSNYINFRCSLAIMPPLLDSGSLECFSECEPSLGLCLTTEILPLL